MDSLPNAVPVTPKPGLARAVGTFNIAFGFSLFLISLGPLDLIGPSLAQNEPFKLVQGEAQNLYEQYRERELNELQALETALTDPTKKENLRAERLELAATHDPKIDDKLDFKSINHALLLINWYFWADFATAPMLNLLMLASGMGLTQLRVWARKLAIWVSILKIVRILGLTLFFTIVVVPQVSRVLDGLVHTGFGGVLLAKTNASVIQSTAGTPPIRFTADNFAFSMSIYAYFVTLLVTTVSLIYSAITLVLLTRPGIKAACCLDELSGSEERESEWS